MCNINASNELDGLAGKGALPMLLLLPVKLDPRIGLAGQLDPADDGSDDERNPKEEGAQASCSR